MAKDKAKALQMLAAAADEQDDQLGKGQVTDEDLHRLTGLAEEMLDLKQQYESHEAKAKELKDRYNQIRVNELPDLMRRLRMVNSMNKGSFTFAGGKVHLQTRLSASCASANQSGFHDWLRKNGAEDLIKPTVHPATLTAFVKERREAGLEDPPGIAVWEETKAVLTK